MRASAKGPSFIDRCPTLWIAEDIPCAACMKLLTSPESLLEEFSRLARQYRYFDWAVA